MFERYDAGEQALLVQVFFSESPSDEPLNELTMLATSAGANVVATVTAVRSAPSARFFVGSGKAEEIASLVTAHGINVVIVNHALSPSQERNLEALCKCRVIDRTGLILDIFAQRARTHEGKLQVELAQLRHISTRLIRGWTHLERQKGGIGLRGPGETQLETDRRLLRERIKAILKRLEKVQRQREQGRRARRRAALPTLSLVGYTNAGKSTLFNRLTQADVYAADQLFATLDPTLRRLELNEVGPVILADTVGFIRELPHDLVAAFKATLKETQEADLLLHVVDVADANHQDTIREVNNVLLDIGAEDVPQLLVYNKIDKLEQPKARIERNHEGRPVAVWLSAAADIGIDSLRKAIAECLAEKMVSYQLRVPAQLGGKVRHALHEMNCIADERYDDVGNWLVNVRLPSDDWNRLDKRLSSSLSACIV